MIFYPIGEIHRLITDLAIRYADDMTQGDNFKTFNRGSLAAAYMIGGEKVLRLICNIIKESAHYGLTVQQANKLLQSIEVITQMPSQECQ